MIDSYLHVATIDSDYHIFFLHHYIPVCTSRPRADFSERFKKKGFAKFCSTF